MDISIRVSGGRATGKTTILKKIEDMIREDYEVTSSSWRELADPIPEEVLYMEFVCQL